MKKILIVLLAVFLILLSCARPPTEEMNRAIEALNLAENDVNAVLYAPNYLSRAREALVRMQEEADSKRFESAKVYAVEVITNAERAVNEGSNAVGRGRDEALNILNNLRVSMSETETNLDTAKQIPNLQLDFNSLDGLFDTAKGTYQNAQQSFSNNNYPDAVTKGQTVRSILSDINTSISGAAVATSQKK